VQNSGFSPNVGIGAQVNTEGFPEDLKEVYRFTVAVVKLVHPVYMREMYRFTVAVVKLVYPVYSRSSAEPLAGSA